MRLMTFGMIVLLASPSMAARTINIALPSGAKDISFSNPSTVTVTYDITCYANDGVAKLSLTSQTLDASKSATHAPGFADSGLCASGASPAHQYPDLNGKKVYMCTASTNTYANAQNACGAGQKFCYPLPQYVGCSTYMGGYAAWIKQEAGLEKTADYGCTWNPTVGSDYFYGSGCTYSVRKIATPAHRVEGLVISATGSETMGAACCEDVQAGGLCKVTITNATPAAGALSSPSFKGGAPF